MGGPPGCRRACRPDPTGLDDAHAKHRLRQGRVYAYAAHNPADFARLVERYGHTAIAPAKYTVSAFLARTLGDLSRRAAVLFHAGPGDGTLVVQRHDLLVGVPPEPSWKDRTSWADLQQTMTYVPGSVEGVQLHLDPRPEGGPAATADRAT